MFTLQQACDIVVRIHRCLYSRTRIIWIDGEAFPRHFLITYSFSFDDPGYTDWTRQMVVDKLSGTSYELPKRLDDKGSLEIDDYPDNRDRLIGYTLADLWQMELERLERLRSCSVRVPWSQFRG